MMYVRSEEAASKAFNGQLMNGASNETGFTAKINNEQANSLLGEYVYVSFFPFDLMYIVGY